MMGNKIDINVSGGGLALGSVSQGDKSKVSGTAALSSTSIDREYEVAKREIGRLGEELKNSKVECEIILAQLESLKQMATSEVKEVSKGRSVLKLIKENFTWAYPAIKDFIKVIWPELLSAIAT